MTNDEWIKAMRAGIPEEGEFPISSYDDLHPGRFLKCGHLKGEPRTLTIVRYKGEKMGMKNGRPQVQGIMTFKEIEKQYCTQKTNEALLRAMFGDDPAAVVGKRVTFRPGKTRGKGGGIVEAIRIAGSPDMTVDELEHTVEYAEKSMRKPETFTLTKTKLDTDRGQAKQPEPTKPRGDIASALSTIEKWSGDVAPLKKGLGEKQWEKEERVQIKAALDALELRQVEGRAGQ
jgi:hypothetical protein